MRPYPASRRLLSVGHGKIRYVTVASRRTIGKRAALDRYLRYAGLIGKGG